MDESADVDMTVAGVMPEAEHANTIRPNDPEPAITIDASNRRSRLLTNPLVLGGLLALVGMNLSTARPEWGIDSSFRVALTQATLDHRRYGIDVVWPYGPLGFLGGPTIISRGLLAVAVAYQFVALTALFAVLVVHLTHLGLARRWILCVLAPFALAVSITDNVVPEMVSVTLILVLFVLWHGHRSDLPAPTAWWVLIVAGSVAGAQVLVKFGPGVVACAVVVCIAASSSSRLRRVPAAIAAIAAGFLVVWFATGQAASSLRPYFSSSFELSSGYQAAQAWGPYGKRAAATGVVAVIAAGVGGFGAYRWVRRDRRAWWVLLPLALTAWFNLKQGLVRWDQWHVVGAFLIVGLLVACIPWERRLLALPVVVLVAATVAALATEPARLRTTWSDRADAALVVLSADRQASELAAAKADIRASYDVPREVVAALAGRSVHAEEWDINAVWANGLEASPLPIMQSYSTYTAELDRLNARAYASSSGPDGVLFNPSTVDDRYALWESPDARVALTCHFTPIVESGDWTALTRVPNICGAPHTLITVSEAPGETVEIPSPSSPNSLVVARFELPSDPLDLLLTTLARPVHYAQVIVDGTSYRLVTGTADDAHIVRSPGIVGGRALPNGRVALSTLSFENIGSGTVTVRFEEIPLTMP